MENQKKEENTGKVLKLTQAAEVLQCHPKTVDGAGGEDSRPSRRQAMALLRRPSPGVG
jgi:hypothetical protein